MRGVGGETRHGFGEDERGAGTGGGGAEVEVGAGGEGAARGEHDAGGQGGAHGGVHGEGAVELLVAEDVHLCDVHHGGHISHADIVAEARGLRADGGAAEGGFPGDDVVVGVQDGLSAGAGVA